MTRLRLRSSPAGEHLLLSRTPPNWDAEFGMSGPLELEIGCGAGGFALAYAEQHPAIRYVAFEWRKKYAREVAHRARERHIDNLRAIEGDARLYVESWFPKESLSTVHVQFPDPWWKRAHQKRAVVQPDFVRALWERLHWGGVFEMRTDVEELATRMLAVLEGAGFHNPLGPQAFHPAEPNLIPSTRERRYLLSGQPVYRARLVKKRVSE